MSIITQILSSEFPKAIEKIRFNETETSHLPTKYEGNVTKALNEILNFFWCGKPGNAATTDAITKRGDGFSTLEIKGSDNIKEQQLNSTPCCRFTRFEELPEEAKTYLLPYNTHDLNPNQVVFHKEYLFMIRSIKTAIYFDPNVIPSSDYSYTSANDDLLNFLENACNCEANKNNPIVLKNDFKGKLTLENRNDDGLNIRFRAMNSISLPKFLNNKKYGLTKKIITEAAVIAFVSRKIYQKLDLTSFANLIHYQDNEIVILVNNK